MSLVAASEVFHSAVDMLPLDGSLALAASGSFSLRQALLVGSGSSPGPQQEEGVGESSSPKAAAGPAPAAAAAAEVAPGGEPPGGAPLAAAAGSAAFGEGAPMEVEVEAAACVPEEHFPVGPAPTAAPTASASGPAGPAGGAPVVREDSVSTLPSLRREFSEVNLQYLVSAASPESSAVSQRRPAEDPTLHAGPDAVPASPQQGSISWVGAASPRATAGQVPSEGEATTPARQACTALPDLPGAPANTPATPFMPMQHLREQQPEHQGQPAAAGSAVRSWSAGAAVPHSMPVAAAGVADAIAGLAGPEEAVGEGDSWAPGPVAAAAGGLAQSPFGATVPLSPNAPTEYDGDDVVMDDAGALLCSAGRHVECNAACAAAVLCK
jgi:hypothetical protein